MDLNEIYTIIWNLKLTRYGNTISLTVFCYDFFLTLGDEIEYIWTMPRGAPKILLYTLRLIVFSFLIFNAWYTSEHQPIQTKLFCRAGLGATGYAAVILVAIANYLLLLRVFALYEQKRVIVISLLVALGLVVVTQAIIVAFTLRVLYTELIYMPIFKICGFLIRAPIFSVVWITPVTFEAVIFGMAAYKIIRHAQFAALDNRPSFWSVILRDGLIYFLGIAVIHAMNLGAWIFAPAALLFIAFFLLWAVISTMILRMFINLRQAARSTGQTGITETTNAHMSIARRTRRGERRTGGLQDSRLQMFDIRRHLESYEMSTTSADGSTFLP